MFIVYESKLCNCLFCPLSTKHFGDKMVLWRIKQIASLSNNNDRMNTKTSRDCAITQWWEIEYTTTRKREWVVAGIIYIKKNDSCIYVVFIYLNNTMHINENHCMKVYKILRATEKLYHAEKCKHMVIPQAENTTTTTTTTMMIWIWRDTKECKTRFLGQDKG